MRIFHVATRLSWPQQCVRMALCRELGSWTPILDTFEKWRRSATSCMATRAIFVIASYNISMIPRISCFENDGYLDFHRYLPRAHRATAPLKIPELIHRSFRQIAVSRTGARHSVRSATNVGAIFQTRNTALVERMYSGRCGKHPEDRAGAWQLDEMHHPRDQRAKNFRRFRRRCTAQQVAFSEKGCCNLRNSSPHSSAA